ncbi:MAG: cell envelope protein SmpA [Methylotenera sp.]|nr:MAG: cell envelope protein SmpA [Methylotenera sp.]
MRYIFSLRYLLVSLVLLCTACGTALPTVKPYKLDVQQGNVVTSKMLLQLRPGMTKSQVRFIMGTPLIQDSFHGNRWDYVYQLREKGKIVEQRRVILDFENELLKSVRGDVIPAGSGPKESESGNTGTRTVQPVDKSKDKGLMDKLKFWKKDDVPPVVVPPADKANQVPSQIDTTPATAPQAPESAPTQPDAPSSATEQAPPAEEPKSILTVPMEVPASPSQPMAEPAPAQAEPTPVEPSSSQSPAQTSQPEPASETPAASEAPYEPPSGMQFDRNLEMNNAPQPAVASPSEVKPAADVQPASAAPARSDNKTPPAPKELPPESDPDFFERMLEKIGF